MSETRSYHHGDLRQALIEEGLRQSRDRGPDAIGLRELTRAVGVSPNAAYRHFTDRQALVRAVATEAQLALARTMSERMRDVPEGLDAASRSIEVLRRVGLGYIEFARAEPGWFAVAFSTQDEAETAGVVTLDDQVVAPFQLLLDALDGMVTAGALAPERRPHAEWPCWSAVHGFAAIAAHGPLRWQPPQVVDALAEVVVDTTIRGVRGG